VGREAACICRWGVQTAEVKVLLESGEVIVRGGIRKRVAFTELKEVTVKHGSLCFRVGHELVELSLGSDTAEKWASAIATPPPTLAKKLGISRETVVRTIGEINDSRLESAIAEAARGSAKDADLIVAHVDTPDSLATALREARLQLLQGVPIWLVYAKGAGHPIGETVIRSTMRGMGMMDTKVASVSAKYTALRFNLQRAE
jgi:hypothetical protein